MKTQCPNCGGDIETDGLDLCPGCGTTLSPGKPHQLKADDLTTLSTEPVLAWEMPGNPFMRLWQTCWQVLLRPSESFASLGVASYWKPLWMGLLLVVPTQAISLIIDALFTFDRLQGTPASQAKTQSELLAWCFQVAIQGNWFFLIESSLWLVFQIILLSGVAHLFLKIFKAASQPFLVTYKTVAYGWIAFRFIGFINGTIYNTLIHYTDPNILRSPTFHPVKYYAVMSGIMMFSWFSIICIKGLAVVHNTTKMRAFWVMLCTLAVWLIQEAAKTWLALYSQGLIHW